MKALVVNCSTQYNLGAAKLAYWLEHDGWEVNRAKGDPGMFAYGYDLVCLSVVFSWHAPLAREIALRVKGNSDVWTGGPGLFTLASWWQKETGLEAVRGLDERFERQRGEYLMTFASRGCPVDCSFCIVPRLEGTEFTEDWAFQPAPILCDNNLSALSAEFQDHIISAYQTSGVPLRDANSGFEPRTFTQETYHRWKPILKGPWRFAYDEMVEGAWVKDMMDILREERDKRKRVYVLVGNEPFEQCYERAQKVLEWGGEPFCQPFIPLNSLDGRPKVRFNWTEQLLRAFARFYNRYLWKYASLAEYRRGTGEPPFRNLIRGKEVRHAFGH